MNAQREENNTHYPSSFVILCLCLGLLIAAALPAQAKTLYVSITPGPGEYASIQAAINAAQSYVDTVIVRPGTYTETLVLKPITLRSEAGPEQTILDGQGSHRVISIGSEVEARVIGFSIQNGLAEDGGGMYISNYGLATIINCTFKNNNASNNGGGLHISDPFEGAIINCTFDGNIAGNRGGGIYAAGVSSDAEITNCTFTKNIAPSGGGLVLASGSSPTISHCIFSENNASATDYPGSGGMHNHNSSPTIINSLFYKNTTNATTGGGAAMTNNADSHPTITNCTFAENTSNYSGLPPNQYGAAGGIGNLDTSSATIINSILWGNSGSSSTGYCSSSPFVYHWQVCDESGLGSFTYTYSTIQDVSGDDPRFVDADNNDFHLQADSPAIDTGKNIAGVYSDIRGSLRPVDVDMLNGNTSLSNNFDRGAYEYSDFSAGYEDGIVKPFWNVRLNSSLIIPGYAYDIRWQNKTPFPGSDRRLSQAGFYTVRFLLYKDGYSVVLGQDTVSTQQPSPDGYTWSFTFTEQHVGTWKLRIELVDDPTLFAESDLEIQTFEVQDWVIGKTIAPPANADLTKRPIWEGDADLFFWNAAAGAQALYAIKPAQDIQLTWRDADNNPIPSFGSNVWCTPADPQLCDLPQSYVAGSAAVDLLPDGSGYDSVSLVYTESDAVIEQTDQFSAIVAGYSVLKYGQGGTSFDFKVIKTIAPEPGEEQDIDIGTTIEPKNGEHDSDCGGGVIINAGDAPYAPQTTGSEPYDGYDRATHAGPIVPVNTSQEGIIVAWYQKDAGGACWPSTVIRYTPRRPSTAPPIVIGGSGVTPGGTTNLQLYAQDDPALPGYNPNEEHALIHDGKVYALRNDLNAKLHASAPYVIVKYQNQDGNWQFQVFQVANGALSYTGTAGQLVQLPLPLNLFQPCAETTWDTDTADNLLWWKDYENKLYSQKAGTGEVQFYYPLQAGFFYDFDVDDLPDVNVGTCIPWGGGTEGPPWNATYNIAWPTAGLVTLNVGDSLFSAQDGLEINKQCSVEIIYDEPYHEPDGSSDPMKSVQLLEAISERFVTLGADGQRVDEVLPADVTYRERGAGLVSFPDLPPHLALRLSYDATKHRLIFRGYYDESAPLLLPNMMSAAERETIKDLAKDATDGNYQSFRDAVDALYTATHPTFSGEAKIIGTDVFKILSAAAPSGGVGYVTLAFNNDQMCSENPVGLTILHVTCDTLARGEIKILEPENPFDARTTFIHSNDFAGNADGLTFEWYYTTRSDRPDTDEDNPTTNPAGWTALTTDGANYYTLGGTGLSILEDKWVTVRYRGYARCYPNQWSAWTKAAQYENWVKRVITAINQFEERFTDFHEDPAATYVNMLQQAGPRYEGDVAFNADNDYLNSIGLIELYTTVLKRARELSIDGTPPQSSTAANNALLFAASRIAKLYLLMGNEAYGDAADPTIGFTTDTTVPGNAAPSIFCFQDQAASLLQEELELLRGRDDSRAPGIETRPVYNRLIWNFTTGDGQVAYVNNYGVETIDDVMDDNGTSLDPSDDTIITPGARSKYPQGHGDAWGHYLSAIKTFYMLLRHDLFTWSPDIEHLNVAGVPVTVDYGDEREFAIAVAAKARTGAEIVNLTYRDAYVDNPAEQWQGYKDDNPERAWGLSEWAVRAGQGAYIDWVVATALLPEQDPNPEHTGIQKIERYTVGELAEIASHFIEIENQLDQADLGLNPLGIAKDAIPFDIDPTEVDAGKTHFEQIYERAIQALNNARIVFDYANQYTQMLRQQADTLETYQQNVAEREADFNNRLIEIFGYPYPDDDCALNDGPDGPDLCHYDYVDPSEFLGYNPTQDYLEFTVNVVAVDPEHPRDYAQPPGCPGPACTCPEGATCVPVTFNISDQLGPVKPPEWTSGRRAPGEIQRARAALLVAKARFDQAFDSYNGLLADIADQVQSLGEEEGLHAEQISIMTGAKNAAIGFNTAMLALQALQKGFETGATVAKGTSESTAECFPKVMGMIAGLSNGWVMDATSPLRCATKATGESIATGLLEAARWTGLAESALGNAKEIVQLQASIKLTTEEQGFAINEKLREIAHLMRDESTARYGLYILYEQVLQAAGAYNTAQARGLRLWQDRTRFRQKVADDIREYRYKDMAFRIFRNEALQKYRAQFDFAAMYTYLAAKAYDYETGLLSAHSRAGQRFLADIVKQRTIGKIQILGSVPMVGSGLANQLAQMAQNFAVLKTQMGFNNPQIEETRFSLREETFRILPDEDSNARWQSELRSHRFDDLWTRPEFRRYCRPFAAEDPNKPEPALVIPFTTNITSGLNFFGFPLSGGDSYYDASRFSTKIRSVGVWFENYNSSALTQTPRIYFVPTGEDFVRVPYSDSFSLRGFSVTDQIIPLPFPFSEVEMGDPNWIPLADLYESGSNYLAIRRHSRMRAYHDGGDDGWKVQLQQDSRLIGRSVWNSNWLLIIPGSSLRADSAEALDEFIETVTDIKFTFQTYSYEGYRSKRTRGELEAE